MLLKVMQDEGPDCLFGGTVPHQRGPRRAHT